MGGGGVGGGGGRTVLVAEGMEGALAEAVMEGSRVDCKDKANPDV